MSAANQAGGGGGGGGGPISPQSALGRALADDPVPPLAADFAERVLAAASARAPLAPPALPPLRRRAGLARGWRTARRIALGGAAFAALAGGAAATGLLERFDLPVPSPAQVWASLTRSEAPASSPPRARAAARGAETAPPAGSDAAVLTGPIDTPAELEEAFRRIDEVRGERSARRRAVIDQRIASELERRRAAGLPVPTPEEEARLRQRLEAARARREAMARQQIEQRRTELRDAIEQGEALTAADLAPPRSAAGPSGARGALREEWQRLSPAERRARLRSLPAPERRALLRELVMQERAQPIEAAPDTPAAPGEVAAPDLPPAEPVPPAAML